MNTERIRKEFPILERRVDGKPLVYLDSAATSLKPKTVTGALAHYNEELGANVHRGVHSLAEASTKEFEGARKKVAGLVGAEQKEIVFTKNATEAINLVMNSLHRKGFFRRGDEILITKLEHHSNLVPWQFLRDTAGVKLKVAELNGDFTLDVADFHKKISKKTKLVAVAHASNTVGSISPVRELTEAAHDAGALCLVDAAQSVGHFPVDVKKTGIDFLAFSGHKMLGPTGIGALYAKQELLEGMPPFLFGGDMISSVGLEKTEWNEVPFKFEAGTPAIAEAIALGKAIDFLEEIGLENIRKHDKALTEQAIIGLRENSALKLFCPSNPEKQAAIVMFGLPPFDCHDVAIALDEMQNISVRSGMLCAEPLVKSLNSKGLCRASFYLYNTKEEVDVFVSALENLKKSRKRKN